LAEREETESTFKPAREVNVNQPYKLTSIYNSLP
jgi:hypothetical protein